MSYLDRLEQVCMEDLYSRKQTEEFILKDAQTGLDDNILIALDCMYEYFDTTYGYESKNTRLNNYFENNEFDLEKLLNKMLIAILPHTTPVSIQTIIGKLSPYLNYENPWDGVKTASELIIVVTKSDLYDVIPAKYSNSGGIEVVSNFTLEEHTLQKIENMKYLPPMICKPDKITRNYQSAYLTKNESVILGKGNHHNKYIALDAINIANSIELSLDKWVLTQKEKSKKPLDTTEKKDNFNRMVTSSKAVYNEIYHSGNKFYFEWKYDKRGRMYSTGYHINIQSTEYKKALINLANPQIIRV